MKVLHISPTYYAADSIVGGGEKYILYMAKALSHASKAIENVILAFGEKEVGLVVNDVRCIVALGKPWDPRTVDVVDLQRRMLDSDIVVVHQCLTAFGLFIASHARLTGKVVVGIDHGGGVHHLVHRTPEACLMYHAFIAQSKYSVSAFHDSNVPVKTILGPIDTTYYYPLENERREKGLVVAVGRILPHKGFDRIIRALPDDMRLVIAGTTSDAEYSLALTDLIRASGADVVVKNGLSDGEIRELLRKASLFVHASTHVDYRGNFHAKPELLGLAPLEALACGTPALVSNAGSLPELGMVVGCDVFCSDQELKARLHEFANGTPVPSAADIHASTKALYGIEQFGERFLAELRDLGGSR